MWLGGVCAVAAIWLSFGFLAWASVAAMELSWRQNHQSFASVPEIGALLLVWLGAFPVASGVAGLVCAFFWHDVARETDYERWGFWVLLLALVPTVLVYGAGLVLFLPCLALFYKAIDRGVKWWPNRRYRHLWGAANDWEREEKR